MGNNHVPNPAPAVTPRAVCEGMGLSWDVALLLRQAGCLSFDPENKLDFKKAQEAELRFLGSLVIDGCDPARLSHLIEWLDESRLGSKVVFDSSVEDLSPNGVGYHGTTASATPAILRSGFRPLSSTIGEERKALILSLAETLFPDESNTLRDQFEGMVSVNFFPVSELALMHTDQRGGQGICEVIKPFIMKALAHPALTKDSKEWITLSQFLDEIVRNQQSFPVVIAVDLQDHKANATWNAQGAYQIEGTVSPDKIVRILGAPRFSTFAETYRRLLLQRAQDLSKQQNHFARDVRIETTRKSVGMQRQDPF